MSRWKVVPFAIVNIEEKELLNVLAYPD